jgi:hypothetical protein
MPNTSHIPSITFSKNFAIGSAMNVKAPTNPSRIPSNIQPPADTKLPSLISSHACLKASAASENHCLVQLKSKT